MPKLFPWGCRIRPKPFFYLLVAIDVVFKAANLVIPVFAVATLLAFLWSKTFKHSFIKLYAGFRLAVSGLLLLVYILFDVVVLSQPGLPLDGDFAPVAGLFGLGCLLLGWDVFLGWSFREMLKAYETHAPLRAKAGRAVHAELI